MTVQTNEVEVSKETLLQSWYNLAEQLKDIKVKEMEMRKSSSPITFQSPS